MQVVGGYGQKEGEKTFLSSGSQLWKICPLSKYLAMTVDTFIVMTGGLLLASGRERPRMLLRILTMHITAPFPQQRMIQSEMLIMPNLKNPVPKYIFKNPLSHFSAYPPLGFHNFSSLYFQFPSPILLMLKRTLSSYSSFFQLSMYFDLNLYLHIPFLFFLPCAL